MKILNVVAVIDLGNYTLGNNNMKDPDGIFENRRPTLFWTDIEPGDTEYSLLIFDITRYTIKKYSGDNHYIVFKSRLINGFSAFLDKEPVYDFHFPAAAFKIAWQRATGHKPKDTLKGTWDCYIKFKRETKKKIVFTYRRYMEAAKYDSSEVK